MHIFSQLSLVCLLIKPRNTLIDALVCKQNSRDSIVLYYYCDYTDQKSLENIQLFGSLVQQLLRQSKIADGVGDMVSRAYRDGKRTPELPEVLQILHSALHSYREVFAVIDGIDECTKDSGRKEILAAIQSLVDATSCPDSAHPDLRVFVTSRADVDIEASLKVYGNLKLTAGLMKPDIDTYIARSVQALIASGDLAVGDENLQEEITNTLIKRASGM
jgi:hypothetical protein